jgi:hypothetical protein
MSTSRRAKSSKAAPERRSRSVEVRTAVDQIDSRKSEIRKVPEKLGVSIQTPIAKPKRKSVKSKAAKDDIYARQTRLGGSFGNGKRQR